MKKIHVFIIAVFICFSCNQKINENELNPAPGSFEEKIGLAPSDTLRIPIGKRTNIHSNYLAMKQLYGKPYLGIINENTNELEFYGLENPGENFNVQFSEDGPDGIGILKGFEVFEDSLLLIAGSNRTQLYISDLKGHIIKRFTTRIERENKPYVPIYYSQQPLVYLSSQNSFLVFTRVDTNYRSPGLWSGSSFLKISNNPDPEISHIFELPKHLSDYVHGAYFCHSSHILVEDRYLILGIPFYNDLLIYDTHTEKTSQTPGGSKYFGDVMPWPNPDYGRDEEFYVSSNSYQQLIHDKANKLLYRVALQAVDYIDPEGQRRNSDNKKPSIIILDQDFEKIGEVDLPINTFYTNNFFVYQGRLYLSLNHPDNNTLEDELVFVGFEPGQI